MLRLESCFSIFGFFLRLRCVISLDGTYVSKVIVKGGGGREGKRRDVDVLRVLL